MKRATTLSSIFLPILLASACGGDETSIDDDDDTQEVDTTAPTILSISPADGAVGQYEDAVVTIAFNEAMDKDSVAATLDASDLGEVTLSWNDAADTLTIAPNNLLAYALGQGLDPDSITANAYTVFLGGTATDAAGNELSSDFAATFHTLKRMSTTIKPDSEMSRSVTPSEITNEVDARFQVGDTASKEGVRAAFTFAIDILPEGVVEVESASFATRQLIGSILNFPYVDLGTTMLIDHVSYSALDSENAINAAYNSNQVAHAELGDFATSASQVVIEHDVTVAVADDLANLSARKGLSQYLLYFDLATDLDTKFDTTFISRELAELQVVYLVP